MYGAVTNRKAGLFFDFVCGDADSAELWDDNLVVVYDFIELCKFDAAE